MTCLSTSESGQDYKRQAPIPIEKAAVLSNKETGWLAGLSDLVALPGIEPGFED
jgi:hypothetical protein